MRTASALLSSAVVAVGLAFAMPAGAMDGETVFSPNQIKWSPGPASIPPGSQAAVLYGDPSKAEMFVLRLKLPKDYHIAPHSHPKAEIVTVISGTFHLGMGEAANRSKAQPLPAGSFFAFAPGMTHYAYTDEETVIQLNSTGPWALTYVNPNDDPRKKSN